MKKTILITILFSTFASFAQVGIGTNTPNTSSALDVTSTTKGLLLPRLTYSQKMAISSPAAGLWIWCTDCGPRGQMQVFNGTSWTNMVGGAALVPTIFLDNLSTNPAAAYSLRKLRYFYNGAAIRVRRSSDNTESDISFTNSGELNQSALLSFVGSGNGFVTIWYDQSGNGLNVFQTNTANQPQIVTNGVVELMNGKPAIKNTATTGLGRATAIGASTQNSMFWVGNSSNSGINSVLFSIGSNSTGVDGGDLALFTNAPSYSENSYRTSITSNFAINTGVILSRVSTGALPTSGTPSTLSAFINGIQTEYTAMQPTSFSWDRLQIGGETNGSTVPTRGLEGKFSEAIVIPVALSTADRQYVQQNQGVFYSITVN